MILRWISLATFLLAVAVLWLSSPTEAHDLWTLKSLVLAGPSLIIFGLTWRPLFKWAYTVAFARVWMFPLLDGDWHGEVHSNWPRIRAMMEAARGDGPRFDALSDPTPAQYETGPVSIDAKIESGLFDIKITLVMSATRRSHTIFVKPEWRRPDRPRLHYMYRQQEDGAVAITDTGQHLGAGSLDYTADGEILSGVYWTERQAEQGLNTAGRIRLIRGRRKP